MAYILRYSFSNIRHCKRFSLHMARKLPTEKFQSPIFPHTNQIELHEGNTLQIDMGTAWHRRLRRFFKMASFEKVKKSYQRFHKERGQVREEKTILSGKLVFNRRQYDMEREFDKQSRIKTKSIRKLSNFNFHWTNKTLYPNNLNNIAFFFTFFNGYRYH